MTQGHRHVGGPDVTINQGNIIGDRPCVRQSKLYRKYDSGNPIREALGHEKINWDVNQQQGAYKGLGIYDHTIKETAPLTQQPAKEGNISNEQIPRRRNYHTDSVNYNILTGESK